MSSIKKKMNSSSSEDDHENKYAMITDEKKRKRMISNRESARRSRMKREQHIKDLNDQVTYFRTKRSEMVRKVNEIGGRYMAIESENRILRMQGEELKKRLELLEEMVVSCQSSSYSSKGNLVNNDDEDDCYVIDILQDPLLKPWLQTGFQTQTIDGIYQF